MTYDLLGLSVIYFTIVSGLVAFVDFFFKNLSLDKRSKKYKSIKRVVFATLIISAIALFVILANLYFEKNSPATLTPVPTIPIEQRYNIFVDEIQVPTIPIYSLINYSVTWCYQLVIQANIVKLFSNSIPICLFIVLVTFAYISIVRSKGTNRLDLIN